MSVSLRLADNDAKIIGDILKAVGDAGVIARNRSYNGMTDSDTAQAIAFGKPVLRVIARHGHGAPEELIRLGHAFDTAHYANAKGS